MLAWQSTSVVIPTNGCVTSNFAVPADNTRGGKSLVLSLADVFFFVMMSSLNKVSLVREGDGRCGESGEGGGGSGQHCDLHLVDRLLQKQNKRHL